MNMSPSSNRCSGIKGTPPPKKFQNWPKKSWRLPFGILIDYKERGVKVMGEERVKQVIREKKKKKS